MGSEEIMEASYKAAMSGDWKSMIDYFQEHYEYLDSPVTSSSDTVLHLALQSNEVQPLEDLLEIVKKGQLPLTEEDFLKRKNKLGNTVLHEATFNGNYEAVRLLVERCPDLLKEKNNYGETPLFTAAAFGEAEIVKFLIRSKPKQCVYDKNTHDDDGLLFPKQCVDDDDDDDDGLLFPIHRQRKDGLSILGAAIIGQHFETALLLLELDGSLHKLKDKKGITALQLLAEMPAAFESLPVRRKVKLQAETSGQAREGVGDVESGLGSSLERKPRGGLLNYFKLPK
ncbi:inversin, partial [Populus alba x Populus x berolinensis]